MRKPILGHEDDIDLLWETVENVQALRPFDLVSHVILPDHIHWLIRVDNFESNYSSVLHSFKRNFTVNYKKFHSITSSFSVWQKRFWDHVIRDEYDLNRHLDYIHWNPVKHGLVTHPEDWPHSSFLEWFERGFYPVRWGWENQPENIREMNFE
jgi:putative transposase